MSRPNFLVIVADDLGFSDVGAFGSEIKTPNIDRLAYDGGLRFTDFHAAAACSPTRSMLLSGTDNHIAGIGAMKENLQEFQKGKPGYEGYLNDRVAPLSEVLQDYGYKTYMSGKWHLGLSPDRWPVKRGFDRSYSLLPGAANHYGYEPQIEEGDNQPNVLKSTPVFYVEDDKAIDPRNLGKDFYSTDRFGDKIIEYLQDHKQDDPEKPFFAYLAFSAPHWPLQAPEADVDDYRGVYDNGPEHLRDQRLGKLKELGLVPEHAVPHPTVAPPTGRTMSQPWDTLTENEKKTSSRTMEVFAGMVQRMDYQIGRVIEQLEKTGDLDNTLILFMSDNGAEGMLMEALPLIAGDIFAHVEKYYDNSLDNIGRGNSYVWYGPQWANSSTAPSRLYKGFSSEGGIRVPFILRYPALTAQKSQDSNIEHSFATVMDIYPTLLQLAGAKHPGKAYKGHEVAPVRGKSWVPYLTSAKAQIHDENSAVGWELFGRLAVRKGIWKATYIPAPYGPDKWELFDLKADPGELNDISEDNKEKLAELLSDWQEYVAEVGVVGQAPEYGTLVLD
ncbi:alkaline phosphatase-like protein [Aureobasidium pullulans]|uniref:Alkaline phosphatase-like protein n=1 Tax=Aureobasidium pullulans TaxID=5580 RepID=A0A4S9JSJ3_AURPU|nr:alkaline phosphatase-like protein [Aureobasidium pullulans]